MTVIENLETEAVRERHDTVFLIIRKFYDDTNDFIETAYHELEDAQEYTEENFGVDELAHIREQVVK